MAVGAVKQASILTIYLMIQQGKFLHSKLVLVDRLMGYDLILGKNFMVKVLQTVDFVKNSKLFSRGYNC
jgi:hypothetical protein